MRNLLLLITLLISNITFAIETVQVTGSIEINTPIEEVFEFVADPMNDHHWRSEVNDMATNSRTFEIGSTFREDAWIGIRKHFITTTELIELNAPHQALFETVRSNPYFLRSNRMFKESENGTIFTYVVDFDRRMIKETFGFNAKPEVVVKLYGVLMKKYLKKLKRKLE
ncbi:polyketide cyclase/dehydrase and lipid transport [Bacteriovorax sp. BAL6_X]|uniref:SRPBCC family protein n=1 Tax=Bacteriovorax sp. BAL6_X TaxID=1201290 RepID=UPI0003860981|nr:SRPBCC family protein [Bacteriovorax sp. BAL6_X]EPZ50026.1 polyketide cyclase/dehydrase and lipid transport [Bacteriovorax sp. BAL6_X]